MSIHVDLKGKIAFVTGASSGLGRHFARALAAHGAAVIVAARRGAELKTLVEEIEGEGGAALALPLDVTNADTVNETLASAVRWRGTPNVLVNNAGIAAPGRAIEMPESDFDAVVNTNLKGAWLMAQAFARALVDAGHGGCIINITSISAHRAVGGLAPYAASKAALESLTRNLALEWARYGIRVNAIAPGYIETDMNRDFFVTDAGRAIIQRVPQRRIGKPADLDGALLLLASDASSFMTGSSIVVDGGHLLTTL
jgi:NAD(P)-dependent dehydrogenase (short-subunit alcohol dehydrogenase family)